MYIKVIEFKEDYYFADDYFKIHLVSFEKN